MGRVPYGLPDDSNDPDILDLFRFDTANGERLFIDNGSSAPPAYFSVDGGITNLVDYGETSDPSDFLNTSDQDPFDEFYDSETKQFLTQLDLTQLDVLGFNTFAVAVWTSGASGDFGVGANWVTSGGTSGGPSGTVPSSSSNVEITQSGTYTVSSSENETINALTIAAGVTLEITGGVFAINNGTDFGTTFGTIEIASGATLDLGGDVTTPARSRRSVRLNCPAR
jgi:hypothetical protein